MSALLQKSPSVIAAFLLVGFYTLYRLVQYGITARRRSIIVREHGCKPYPKYPHRDPILGIDFFLENMKLTRTGGFLERTQQRYQEVNEGCWTFSQLLLGDTVLNTAEPENIKAILATQFKDFNLPPRRKAAFQPVFGHGIFTTDGKEWETSRALLRPNFSRSQVGDLDTFESHISKMVARLPTDGSTVDLQAYFFMLTIDSGKMETACFCSVGFKY